MKYPIIYTLSIFLLLACNSEEKKDQVQSDKHEQLKSEFKDDLTCAYEINRIFTAPTGELMITSGYRICQDEILTNEVIAFEKSEALGDKESNVYVSEDLRPTEVKWEDGQLIISHYFDSIPLLKAKEIYNTKIIYRDINANK